MNSKIKELCWAAAILAVAFAGMFDWIPDASSVTLVVVLLACMNLSGQSRCGLRRKA